MTVTASVLRMTNDFYFFGEDRTCMVLTLDIELDDNDGIVAEDMKGESITE